MISESAWFVDISLADAPQIKQALDGCGTLLFQPEEIFERIGAVPLYKKLKQLADYPVKTMSNGARRHSQDDDAGEDPPPQSFGSTEEIIVNMSQTLLDDNGNPIIRIPKAKYRQALQILKNHGITPDIQWRPFPKPSLSAVLRQFPNPNGEQEPAKLEPLQIKAVIKGLARNQSGVFHYAMGGGKTMLIAALLRAFPALRPAVITSAASADSQQLAAKLARLTGEPTHLAGCTSGALTAREKKNLFSETSEASIIVGSHRLYDRLHERAAGKAAVLVEKILAAKLVLIDEIHECTTPNKIAGLVRTNPDAIFGFTATWGKNWSGTHRILNDMLNREAELLCDTSHLEVQTTGRVTPAEITGHTFRRPDWPQPFENAWYGFTFFQREVDNHPGRNRFLAKMLHWLMEKNTRENRGAILAFALSIKHIGKILRELHAVRGTGPDDPAIHIYNARLSENIKTNRLKELAGGTTRLVLATEALSRGIDINTIYDIVDLTGNAKTVQLIQKSGRSVRPLNGKTARIHIIMEEDLPQYAGREKIILRKISEKKRRELELYFGTRATILTPENLPFRQTD
jgi:superfamily II DNA or RNA helicase